MNSAAEYRTKAAVLAAQARDEAHKDIRDELLRISRGYLRLAEQAERNSHLDVWYETPPEPHSHAAG